MIWVGYGILKIRSWIRIRNKSFATLQSGTGTANIGYLPGSCITRSAMTSAAPHSATRSNHLETSPSIDNKLENDTKKQNQDCGSKYCTLNLDPDLQ